MAKEVMAQDVRELLQERFGQEILGQIYRTTFVFDNGEQVYFKLWEKEPAKLPKSRGHIYRLKLYEKEGDEPSFLEFSTQKALVSAAASFKRLGRFYEIASEIVVKED